MASWSYVKLGIPGQKIEIERERERERNMWFSDDGSRHSFLEEMHKTHAHSPFH